MMSYKPYLVLSVDIFITQNFEHVVLRNIFGNLNSQTKWSDNNHKFLLQGEF